MPTNDPTRYATACVICGAELAAGSKCLCAGCQKKAQKQTAELLRGEQRRVTWRSRPEGEGS